MKRGALAIPPIRRLHESRNALLAERDALLARVTEAERKAGSASGASPFFHYHASFDPQEVIRRHAVASPAADPRYFTNFLGVRIDPKYLPEVLKGTAGTVDHIPIPANWHADIAEWGGALRAVDLAKDSFSIIELGCGWGCWLNNAGVAARRAGLKVSLIGVEGDEGHAGFAVDACGVNGFDARDVVIHHGIAAAVDGVALFPVQERAGIQWGLEPLFNTTAEQRRAALAAGTHAEVQMVSLASASAAHARIDLLHVDIQGGEADLVEGSIDLICEKVAYLLVGTHSRQIEGRLFRAMLAAGWRLEIERPAILTLAGDAPLVMVDGVQGWRNPRLF